MELLFPTFKSQVLFLDLLCLLLQQQEQLIVICNEIFMPQVLVSSGDLVVAPAICIEGVEFA